ncbi:MAG: septal ring lytic transglycosylase RlpA family protein [Treponema sp.]|jgi:rare lipoprotein A|nr:septal ring lytic transglycosylase RlpA family protein [Treponema sp.]
MKKYAIIIISLAVAAFCFADDPFHEEGLASWYGEEFDGENTASGEKFDSSQFTAAHPSLPFGTLLTVTNQYNRKQVTVRVNDRGPFVSTRIIDLSKAAAEQIDMIAAGTTSVAIDLASKGTPLGPILAPTVPTLTAMPSTDPTPVVTPIETTSTATVSTTTPAIATMPSTASIETVPTTAVPAIAPTTAPTPTITMKILPSTLPPTGTNKKYRIQIGAFGVPNNAIIAFNRLKAVGLTPSYERNDKDKLYRVVLSGVKSDDFVATIEKIERAGFKEAVYHEEP